MEKECGRARFVFYQWQKSFKRVVGVVFLDDDVVAVVVVAVDVGVDVDVEEDDRKRKWGPAFEGQDGAQLKKRVARVITKPGGVFLVPTAIDKDRW